ncbi:hypothetical protein KIW84_035347 [Lathyrus oleraceus]|uniref:Uncharacterized protein n=1 Tax=Pisum sativum TaxID=3888 RepID=A0A9D5B5W2_PEA|nr:hypothetical protein KIW84_035347 [Pisum sativum]
MQGMGQMQGQHQMQFSSQLGHQQFQSRQQLSSAHMQHGLGQTQLKHQEHQMLQNQQYKQQYQQQGQLMQEVSPDFYIPDFNEDLHKADERIDQHTQDKHIQRDDKAFCNQIGKPDQSNDSNSRNILFDEIFSKFVDVHVQQRETFLELLEPYILKDMLGSLPPEIMQGLVELIEDSSAMRSRTASNSLSKQPYLNLYFLLRV